MKSIIFTLLATLTLSWCSCSDEMPDGGDEGVDVTLKASFITEDLKTKSLVDDEKTINKKLLLVFNDKDVCLGYSIDADTVKAKSGSVRIVGIANPDEELVASLNKGEGLFYTDVFNKVTKQQLLDPTNLIKVGVLKTSLEANTKPALKIEVSHLPARVDMIVKLEGKDGDKFELQKYSVTGINVASNLILEQTDIVQNKQTTYAGVITDNTNVKENTLSFYTYERATTETNCISITVEGRLKKDQQVETKRYKITLNPVKNNVGSRTDGIVHGYIYELTGTINVKNGIEVTIKVVPWGEENVGNVEFGGENSNNNNKKGGN